MKLVKILLVLFASVSFYAFGNTGETETLPVVAFWQFNENDPYADSSGNGNNLNHITREIHFDGNYAKFLQGTTGSLGKKLNFNEYTALTIEFFIRVPDNFNENMFVYTYHSDTYIASKTDVSYFGLHAGAVNNRTLDFLTATWEKTPEKVEKDEITSSPLADHDWHHVAIVMDASNDDETVLDEMKVYIDGVLQTPTEEGAIHHSADFVNTGCFILGSCESSYASNDDKQRAPRAADFVGDIDDFRITGAALTPEQFLKAPTIEESEVTAEYTTWTGEGNSQDWEDGDNWSTKAAPIEGSKVHIPAMAYVKMNKENPTANLAEIKIDGTLVFASSNNCLKANDVYISNSGLLLGSEPFKGEDGVSNRVWVVCENMTIAKGGAINVNGRGFVGGLKAEERAWGPGGCPTDILSVNSFDQSWTGASHGGNSSASYTSPPTYGSAEYPETAGSSGTQFKADYIRPGDGGGVVRIDASGHVEINGRITADAHDLQYYTASNNGRSSAGAGGSILIISESISGDGILSAKGGHSTGQEGVTKTPHSWAGGGGRIAVHYNPEIQTADDFNLIIEVQGGLLRSKGSTYSHADSGVRMSPGLGTLYLTDTKVITKENLTNLRGRLVNAQELVFDGDLVISNWVGMATDGTKVKVNGDFIISGKNGRFEIGSVRRASEQTYANRRSYTGSITPELEVTGNLIITNAARFDIYCAITNDSQKLGAKISIGETFFMATNTFVYPVSHPTLGTTAKFCAKDFVVCKNAKFGMEGAGYAGSAPYNYGRPTWCPGKGASSIGAGHGGLGGNADGTYGMTYGDAMRPITAGSGSGDAWGNKKILGGGIGGGALHVVAENSMHIAGILNVDGTKAMSDYNNGRAGGSGGSILLETQSLTLADTAKITAKGGGTGSGKVAASKTASSGGGGRISIWANSKYLYDETIKPYRIKYESSIPEEWEDIISVAAGANEVTAANLGENASIRTGEDGTFRLVTISAPPGMTIVVR